MIVHPGRSGWTLLSSHTSLEEGGRDVPTGGTESDLKMKGGTAVM